METALTARGLAKTYAGDGVEVLALRGVDLDVEAGELVALMGPSGCGKSTLLNLLAGLDRPTAGSIALAGRHVESLSETQWAVLRRREVGVLFQFFNLVQTLTVAENVELPARLIGASRTDARRRREELLDRLGVSVRADALPSRLSGGQQQRVALARALVNRPRLLLADEPTGNLDSESAREVVALLRELANEGQTTLLVTHDPRVAASADRVLQMRDGLVVDEARLEGGDPAAVVSSLLRLEV
ncbi:MAG TPA: ABC transporter ATP-binding protein [Gaiellaceae bacterium]|nr:ABC transporter ATP-binding protein [Gaiellaceae bacterium]